MNKIKEWYHDNKGYEREQKATRVFQEWYNKGNLVLKHGNGRKVEDIFGLPYTSTSDYAAIWNCQAEAVLKTDESLYFQGIAMGENDEVIAVFERRDAEGNEIEWVDIALEV